MKEKGARGPVDLGFAPTGAETRSKGEFNSVCQAIGGYEKLIDQNCKDKDLLALVTYIAEEDRIEKMLKNQKIIKTPIVRNGKQATVGYQPDVWKGWK